MRVLGAFMFSIVVLLGIGCVSSEPVSSSSEGFSGAPLLSMPSKTGAYDVAIRMSPATPSQGEQTVEYTVTDSASGAPVSGLLLSIVPWMPAMGHGTSLVPTVADMGQGVYVATQVAWFMPGQWVLRTTMTGVDAGADGGGVASDYVEPSFEIP